MYTADMTNELKNIILKKTVTKFQRAKKLYDFTGFQNYS